MVTKEDGWGKGIVTAFGMHIAILKWITRTYCIAQGTRLNVMWQLGWQGSLGETRYTYMYG